MALVLFNATADSSTQNKAGTIIATDVCNSHELRQQTSEYNLTQRPVNPFRVTDTTDTNADAAASASAPTPTTRHLDILEAALDLTLACAPATENINENTYPRPPSHAIKIRRSRRSIRGSASGHENDNHSRSDNDDRAQDEQLYDMATWRMYHRIMESRRRHPATCTLDATAICKAKQEAAATYTIGALSTVPLSQHTSSDEDESQLHRGGATTPLSKPRSSSILDAAIFDLDL